MAELSVIDLFAGPGGWDLACRTLGLDPLGVEIDDAACATREAAGLRTVQASVAELDPLDFPCELLIASPPCPTFSTAGKGAGIEDMDLVYAAADRVAAGEGPPPSAWKDERSALVIEPLRWALASSPRFLAWEQVPPVLPFWEHCAEILRRKGWNVWTGKVEAERYGVPQTRERAILMADREAPVHPPRPTHQRYVKGEPQRHEVTLEGEVLPWVSMAEALPRFQDGPSPSPSPTVSGGGTGSGGGIEVFASATSRDRASAAVRLVNGNQDNATEREAEEPASTIAFGHNAARVEWVMEKRDDKRRARQEDRDTARVAVEPAATDPDYKPGDTPPSNKEGAIRVTLEEALILQSFPPDYPVQGNKSQRFLQVGNAVPPLLAHAILSALVHDG